LFIHQLCNYVKSVHLEPCNTWNQQVGDTKMFLWLLTYSIAHGTQGPETPSII